MVIQVVNFNLEGIGHEDYMGAAKKWLHLLMI